MKTEYWNQKVCQKTQETGRSTACGGLIAQKDGKLNRNCQVIKTVGKLWGWGISDVSLGQKVFFKVSEFDTQYLAAFLRTKLKVTVLLIKG